MSGNQPLSSKPPMLNGDALHRLLCLLRDEPNSTEWAKGES